MNKKRFIWVIMVLVAVFSFASCSHESHYLEGRWGFQISEHEILIFEFARDGSGFYSTLLKGESALSINPSEWIEISRLDFSWDITSEGKLEITHYNLDGHLITTSVPYELSDEGLAFITEGAMGGVFERMP